MTAKKRHVQYMTDDGKRSGQIITPTLKAGKQAERDALAKLGADTGYIRSQTVGARSWAVYRKHGSSDVSAEVVMPGVYRDRVLDQFDNVFGED